MVPPCGSAAAAPMPARSPTARAPAPTKTATCAERRTTEGRQLVAAARANAAAMTTRGATGAGPQSASARCAEAARSLTRASSVLPPAVASGRIGFTSLWEERPKAVAGQEPAEEARAEEGKEQQIAFDSEERRSSPAGVARELFDDALVHAGPAAGRESENGGGRDHCAASRASTTGIGVAKRSSSAGLRRARNATAHAESAPSRSPSGSCVGTKAMSTARKTCPTLLSPCSPRA